MGSQGASWVEQAHFVNGGTETGEGGACHTPMSHSDVGAEYNVRFLILVLPLTGFLVLSKSVYLFEAQFSHM